MTTTERLCELLDERDIEWHRSNGKHGMVIWERDGLTYSAANAWPRNDGTRTKLVLHVCYITPEQAIAATVGEEHEMHICKRCGVAYELNIIDKEFGKPRFCPNCGFKEMYQ